MKKFSKSCSPLAIMVLVKKTRISLLQESRLFLWMTLCKSGQNMKNVFIVVCRVVGQGFVKPCKNKYVIICKRQGFRENKGMGKTSAPFR